MEGDAALHRRQVTELYQFTDRTTLSVEISRNGVTETIRTTPEHPFAIYGSDARALSQREARGHAPANMAEWAERLNLPELASQADGDVALLDRTQAGASAMSWVKAADLKPGDRLILAEGEDAARVVALSADEGLSTVYNFAVDVDHTYFVGATKVWVHNIYTADAEQRLSSSQLARARGQAHREGRYAPELQLSDVEYERRSQEYILELEDGRYIQETVYPDLGKDLEIFINEFEPEFVSDYSRIMPPYRIVDGNLPYGNSVYTSEYVSYLAAQAADIYDGALFTPAERPPLYDRTAIVASAYNIVGAGGVDLSTAIVAPTYGGGLYQALRLNSSSEAAAGGTIGRSGFVNYQEFSRALLDSAQRSADAAYARYQNLSPQRKAELIGRGNERTAIGRFVDRAVNGSVRSFLIAEGLSEGRRGFVSLDRQITDPSGQGRARRPDIFSRTAGFLADVTIGQKTDRTQRGQIRDFARYAGTPIVRIVQPSQIGQSYDIIVGPNRGQVGYNQGPPLVLPRRAPTTRR